MTILDKASSDDYRGEWAAVAVRILRERADTWRELAEIDSKGTTMKWYAVKIYTSSRIPIETELPEGEKGRLENDWMDVYSESSHVQRYEGRIDEEFRVEKTEANPYGWETRYVPSYLLVNLFEVVAIEWHEAVEQGE
jgi:hypothetical protein